MNLITVFDQFLPVYLQLLRVFAAQVLEELRWVFCHHQALLQVEQVADDQLVDEVPPLGSKVVHHQVEVLDGDHVAHQRKNPPVQKEIRQDLKRFLS